jgi:chromosome segregation ATPase
MATHELLRQKFKEVQPQLSAVADELDKLGDLEERTKTAQTALKDLQSQAADASRQHEQEIATLKGEIASLQQAQEREAAQLKGARDHVKATKGELAELQSQVRSATYHRDRALEGIQALVKQITA